jgi:hypothetical protein
MNKFFSSTLNLLNLKNLHKKEHIFTIKSNTLYLNNISFISHNYSKFSPKKSFFNSLLQNPPNYFLTKKKIIFI